MRAIVTMPANTASRGGMSTTGALALLTCAFAGVWQQRIFSRVAANLQILAI
jgi:hypothetical protein